MPRNTCVKLLMFCWSLDWSLDVLFFQPKKKIYVRRKLVLSWLHSCLLTTLLKLTILTKKTVNTIGSKRTPFSTLFTSEWAPIKTIRAREGKIATLVNCCSCENYKAFCHNMVINVSKYGGNGCLCRFKKSLFYCYV